MTEVWRRAALWLGLALAATLISIRLRVDRPGAPGRRARRTGGMMIATHNETLFDGLRRQAQERNMTLHTYVLVGHPADQILKAAARHGANLIVVGPRGRSAIREWVSGSTSRRVFTHAMCPVLVVRAR
jgi:nucleotide-binding universal stress UspA family protein